MPGSGTCSVSIRSLMSRPHEAERMKWSRAALFVTAVVGSAGAVQQGLTVRSRTRYPAPGLLGHVDGHQMHLQVRRPDSAAPTVVLEAGMGSFSPNWCAVQTDLAPTARTLRS